LTLSSRETWRLFGILATLNVLWGPVNALVGLSSQVMSTGAILCLRWTLFAISLWALLTLPAVRRLTRTVFPSPKGALNAFLIGIACVGPSHALYYTGVRLSSSTETTVLNVSAPVWTAFLAIFILGERVGRLRWIATAVVCAGAYIVAIGFQAPMLDAGHTVGNLIYLGGVFVECLAMVLAIRVIRQSSGMGALVWEVTGAAVTAWLLAWLLPGSFGFSVTAWTLATLWPIAYLAVVCGAVCFGVWYMAAENAPITLMSLTLAVQGVVAALVGTMFLGERLTVEVVVGFLIIFAALMLATRERHEPAPEPAGFLVGDIEG